MLLSYGMQFNYINMSQWLFKTASQLKKLISKQVGGRGREGGREGGMRQIWNSLAF